MNLRATGRTTKMLRTALKAQEYENVLIIVPNLNIEQHIRKMADKVGLKDSQVYYARAEAVAQGKWRGFRGDVFEDHTVWEMCPENIKPDYLREVGLVKAMTPQKSPEDVEEEERLALREELRRNQAPIN